MIKEKEFYYMSKDKKTRIHAKLWIPKIAPKAILQISHGMKEHIGRYEEFAIFMAQNGYLVTANDHLGHGYSVRTKEHYGYFQQKGAKETLVEDVHTLREITEELYPNLPYFMLGHSMGSFILRNYIMLHGEGLFGVLLMGTGSQPNRLLKTGKALIAGMVPYKGWGYKSAFIDRQIFFNAREHLTKEEQELAWMSRDEKVLKEFEEDPYCNFLFTLNGYYTLLDLMLSNNKKSNLLKMPKNMPVLFLSGTEDPVGNFSEGVKKVYREFVDAGMCRVYYKFYKDARHELLNELNKEEVYDDILYWLECQRGEAMESHSFGCSIMEENL